MTEVGEFYGLLDRENKWCDETKGVMSIKVDTFLVLFPCMLFMKGNGLLEIEY